MILTAFLLLLLGLLLVYLEFYLPGGVMGVSGGIMIVISIFYFASLNRSPWEVGGFIVLATGSLIFLIRFTLWQIRHMKPGRGIYSWGDQEGYRASSYDQTLFGKEGIVTSDLKPGGHVRVEGKVHPAVSQVGYLPKGTKIIVVSGEGDTLFVKRKE